MKYTVSTTIDRPIDKAWDYFMDARKLKEWMPGLQSIETIEGVQGMPGAKAKMVFNENGRQMEMIETILEKRDREYMKGIYEAKGVWNLNEMTFKSLDENRTQVDNYTEFKFSGFMKIIGLVFGSTFKKQSQKYLDMFKAGVEKTYSL